MAEDTKEAEIKTAVVTHQAKPPRPIDPQALKRSIESGIKKEGTLSKDTPALSPEPFPPFPTEKMWPTKEAQDQALAEIPNLKEAVPAEVKEELRGEAKRFNAMAEPGEPLRQSSLKRILETQKKMEPVERTMKDTLRRASKVPPEAKWPASLQKKEQTKPPSPMTPPPPETPKEIPRRSFFRRILDTLGRI